MSHHFVCGTHIYLFTLVFHSFLLIAGIEDSEFALAMERHAPSTLFMGSAFNVPAVNMQPPYTTGLCGNASDDLITPQTESVQPMDSFSAQGVLCPQSITTMIFIDVDLFVMNIFTCVHYLVCLSPSEACTLNTPLEK